MKARFRVGIVSDDPARFLTPMLERVQAERDKRCRFLHADDTEDAAFLAKLVVVVRVDRPVCCHEDAPDESLALRVAALLGTVTIAGMAKPRLVKIYSAGALCHWAQVPVSFSYCSATQPGASSGICASRYALKSARRTFERDSSISAIPSPEAKAMS